MLVLVNLGANYNFISRLAIKRLRLEIINPTYKKILFYNSILGYTYSIIST